MLSARGFRSVEAARGRAESQTLVSALTVKRDILYESDAP